MLRTSAVCFSSTRALTPAALLKTVRSDPGMTAAYYANRYFGMEKTMNVTHVLWSQLKRHGKVTLERSDGSEHPPRWYPIFESPKLHEVHWHNPEDEDLSILKEAAMADGGDSGSSGGAPAAPQAPPVPGPNGGHEADALRVESLVLHLVQQEPGKDIQHYIGLLPFEMRMAGPSAFRHLRESGLLTRETTPTGTFVWQ